MEGQVRQVGNDSLPGTRKIDENHRFVFTLITISIDAILSTSLLTEKVFRCPNFANKCNVVYLSSGLTSFVLASFFFSLNFTTLMVYGWLLVPCKIAIVLVGMFGNGMIARNLFILCYGINGALKALILQSCTYVISRHFTNSAFAVLYSGYPGGSILIGVVQYLLEHAIEVESIEDMRFCLVLCHLVQAVTATAALVWITYLYANYHEKTPNHKNVDHELGTNRCEPVSLFSKAKKFLKALSTVHYFFPRFLLQVEATIIRYFFYPCLIPFLLEISDNAKLIITLAYNFCDFVGMIVYSGINEKIDPLARRLSQPRLLFVFLRDVYLHIIGLVCVGTASFVILASWIKIDFIAKSPTVLFFITVFICFAIGSLSSRAVNGCFPLVEYYSTQTKDDGSRIFGDEILKMDNIINDVVVFLDYSSCVLASSLSNMIEQIILNHRGIQITT
ncbi:hypothetical protein BEWA_027930 [Theileria equi strain WA]|uniref:Uncharacterized protein n=1 Tax=Theileria equi strain WA TaxID=1537102 RepID=L0AYJ0_THEEQ|nr:hypothetical protein BEWA_027930 [Theileria equi strain WA]AFZ79944.1 hypothetical protein BEWA_027930 [Theileria equi strain WA]|eukprot:XP_004829610.1 hypothetical protein BEWA_027930 [Theileria equi strain WA]